MLVPKSATPYIYIFKTVTGEEIITKVVSEDITGYMIDKPLQMAMTQRGPQFAPVVIMMDQDRPIFLAKDKVVMSGPAIPELEGQYESLTTGIALPPKSSIITG